MICQRHILHCLLLWLLLFAPEAFAGIRQETEKTIPLPIHELSKVVADWYNQSGFTVSQVVLETGGVQMAVRRANVNGQITLIPWSALATKVAVVPADDNENSFGRQLWWFLSDYINTQSTEYSRPSPPVPAIVLSKVPFAVCIQSGSGESMNRFSGVFVDGSGLILCTAHGLQMDRTIMVTVHDGRTFNGTIIRRDAQRDLALLRISLKTEVNVSLATNRSLFEMGEIVFSIGCVKKRHNAVYSGKISGPPVQMDKRPLWRVDMEIHHGNSGSPVYDQTGNFMAIVKGRLRGTSSVGFLIPRETIITFLNENMAS